MKKRHILWVLILLITGYLVGIASGFYQTEYGKKPIVQDMVNNQDVGSLYGFYLTSTPDIIDRPYYGNSDADITLIMYSSPTAPALAYFISEILPSLQQDYVSTGKMRIYQKHHLTSDDMADRTPEYLLALSLECFLEKDRAHYYDFYFSLVGNIDAMHAEAEKYGVDLGTCREEYSNLLVDMSEVENFGMVGLNPRFYIGFKGKDNTILDGVPSLARFKRGIRNLQVQIGD